MVERIQAAKFPCLVPATLLIKTFLRHEAMLSNAFEDLHSLAAGTIKIILGVAYLSLPTPYPQSHSLRGTIKYSFPTPQVHRLSSAKSFSAATSVLLR